MLAVNTLATYRKRNKPLTATRKGALLSTNLSSEPMTFKVVRSDRLSMPVQCRLARTIELNEALVHTDMLSKPAKAMNLRTTSAGH